MQLSHTETLLLSHHLLVIIFFLSQGLYCVWDVGNPGGPQYVLEGSGQPTVCCFSATQVWCVMYVVYVNSVCLLILQCSM